MFTGITQGLFPVNTVLKQEGLLHYTVVLNQNLVKDLKLGASVAIDGVCQTVVSINGFEIGFDAMLETLSKTTLSELAINKKVSVERSISLGDEIGGHEVSGHVFEKGEIIAKKNTDNNLCLTIQCSGKCFAFIKPKGFIAVDGSSLTVGVVNKAQHSFEVYLIPETLRVTNFANKKVGDHVNLEPDMKTMILVETIQSHFADIYHRLEKLENQLKVK